MVSSKRKPAERAKDVLYIHDTLELFARSSSSLKDLWADRVRPELGRRSEAKARRARRHLFNAITDTVREAAIMSAGRTLSPQALLDLCQVGLAQLMDDAP